MHNVVVWSDLESEKTSPDNEVLPVDVESNSSSESEAPLAKMQKSEWRIQKCLEKCLMNIVV